jgi:hypothetical protein
LPGAAELPTDGAPCPQYPHNGPHRVHVFHTKNHVLPYRKLQVNAEEIGTKTKTKGKIRHKNLKFTTNAEDRLFQWVAAIIFGELSGQSSGAEKPFLW